MSRLLLRGIVLGGLIALALAGCEEIPEKPVGPPSAPKTAPLYREIGAKQLLERWTVLHTGAVAEGATLSRAGRLAAATEGFRGLPDTFRFSDARQYGSCAVFTLLIDIYDDDGAVAQTEPLHVIDCIGSPADGNAVDGLFHAANLCENYYGYLYSIHIIRAGDFDPVTYPHPVQPEPPGEPGPPAPGEPGEPGPVPLTEPEAGYQSAKATSSPEVVLAVDAAITAIPSGVQHSDVFTWRKHIPIEGHAPVLVYWAIGSAYEENNNGDRFPVVSMGIFDELHSAEELLFTVDHSTGIVRVKDNDGAAFSEYERRCNAPEGNDEE